MPKRDSRTLGPVRVALVGVALAGGCAVYEIPTTGGNADGFVGGDGFGGSRDDDGNPGGWSGQPTSLAIDAGQAGANDGGGDDGGSGNGGRPGDSDRGAAGATSGAADGGRGASLGGNGGTAGDSDNGGESTSSAGSPSCAAGWRKQSSCDQCATQTQPDLQACAVILDCYVDKACGPRSCATTDQVCGPNVLRQGAAAYSIAQAVYDCMCE